MWLRDRPRSVVSPRPSCPTALAPQHFTLPFVNSAQVKNIPAATFRGADAASIGTIANAAHFAGPVTERIAVRLAELAFVVRAPAFDVSAREEGARVPPAQRHGADGRRCVKRRQDLRRQGGRHVALTELTVRISSPATHRAFRIAGAGKRVVARQAAHPNALLCGERRGGRHHLSSRADAVVGGGVAAGHEPLSPAADLAALAEAAGGVPAGREDRRSRCR